MSERGKIIIGALLCVFFTAAAIVSAKVIPEFVLLIGCMAVLAFLSLITTGNILMKVKPAPSRRKGGEA